LSMPWRFMILSGAGLLSTMAINDTNKEANHAYAH
jgi:hypothetical protein